MKGILCSILLSLPLVSFCQNRGTDVVIGKSYAIQSAVLGEKRSYAVYLPNGYSSEFSHPKKYPVIYVLDGEAHFHSLSGLVNAQSSGLNWVYDWPEMIIVAVGNTDRMRDLSPTHIDSANGVYQPDLKTSGGGPAFLEFLNDELFPHIETTYRTQPYRILIGHSLGGSLALHALCKRPGMFNAFIVIDPSIWWDNKLALRELDEFNGSFQNRKLFVAEAGHRPGGDAGMNVGELIDLLQEKKPGGLLWKHQLFGEETHGSVPLLAEYFGLKFIFEGFRLPAKDQTWTAADLADHYEGFSRQLGISFPPPERLLTMTAYFRLANNRFDEAVALYELAIVNYPKNYTFHRQLGDAVLQLGDQTKALEHYRKALDLNPSAREVKTRIARLGKAAEESPR